MSIEVKSFEQVQDEVRDAIIAVLDANGITSVETRLGTLIGAAVGYANAQRVTRDEFILHTHTCMEVLGLG